MWHRRTRWGRELEDESSPAGQTLPSAGSSVTGSGTLAGEGERASTATIAVGPKAGVMCNWGQMPGNGARVRSGLAVAFPVTCDWPPHLLAEGQSCRACERTSPMLRCALGAEPPSSPTRDSEPHQVSLRPVRSGSLSDQL